MIKGIKSKLSSKMLHEQHYARPINPCTSTRPFLSQILELSFTAYSTQISILTWQFEKCPTCAQSLKNQANVDIAALIWDLACLFLDRTSKLMSKEISRRCPICNGRLMEVNYDEGNNNIEYISYVMQSGNTIRGKVQKFVCSGCYCLQSFVAQT